MSQISKVKLDKSLEKELFRQFWTSLGRINSSQKSADFFSDILTSTERLMIAKRFATAILLIRGKTLSEIRNAIHLSYSAIGTTSAWVKNARPETTKLLNSISKEKSLDIIFDKIDSVLDKIPPRSHSNWTEEYKRRRIEAHKRSARNTLR